MRAFEKQKEYHSTSPIQTFIPLIAQPKYAIIAALLSILFISASLVVVSNKDRSFVQRLSIYVLSSAIGSVFFGMAAVFSSDSFGVYV